MTSLKLPRILEEYGLDGLDDELERRWVDDGNESMSLRDLSRLVNRRIADSVASNLDLANVELNPDSVFRALADDEVTSGTRIEVEATLERAGYDPETIRQDFVSHQAVHTYLREARGVRPSNQPADVLANRKRDLQKLQGRLAAVSEGTLEDLQRSSRIDLGAFEVTVDARVFCSDCETQFELTELLDRGGCGCGSGHSAG